MKGEKTGKIPVKCLDRLCGTGYNEQACKSNVAFGAQKYDNSNRKAP